MSFISWQYALFLPAVAMLYWRLPQRGRIWLLFAASYVFYGAWDLRFIALLLTSTCVDFFCGLGIAGHVRTVRRVLLASALPAGWLTLLSLTPNFASIVPLRILFLAWFFPPAFALIYSAISHLDQARRRRSFLWLSVATNLGLLGFFKYANFFADSFYKILTNAGATVAWNPIHIMLPIAISFYTFQSIAYSVDIFRGKVQPISDYPTFAAYLSFFPQLIAGPIERPAHLAPQFLSARGWTPDHFHTGARLILGGLFKKVFVADNCAIVANFAFDPKTSLNAPWALLGVVAFAIQIYGDFSGYTDIARGSARWLGIELTNNFRFPYFAQNPSDFWRRWHITLSTWFRDYVYIPLGGNRGSSLLTARNLLITMLVAGLWHGASWNFVLWGGYHGVLLAAWHFWATKAANRELADVPPLREIAKVFGMLIATLLGWTIFRCRDLPQLVQYISAFCVWSQSSPGSCIKPLCWVLLHSIPLVIVQLIARCPVDELKFVRAPILARSVIFILVAVAIASSAVNDIEFIYFQF